jgi:sugar phosphate permease
MIDRQRHLLIGSGTIGLGRGNPFGHQDPRRPDLALELLQVLAFLSGWKQGYGWRRSSQRRDLMKWTEQEMFTKVLYNIRSNIRGKVKIKIFLKKILEETNWKDHIPYG